MRFVTATAPEKVSCRALILTSVVSRQRIFNASPLKTPSIHILWNPSWAPGRIGLELELKAIPTAWLNRLAGISLKKEVSPVHSIRRLRHFREIGVEDELAGIGLRSEERRVGKECRSGWWPES